MTEAEWLACTDPDPMVRFLWQTGSKRKLRLFAAACCRRILHLVPDERHRAAVHAVEQFADGLLPMCRVEAIEAEALSAPMPEGGLSPAFEAAWMVRNLPNCCRHDDPAGLILDSFCLIQMAAAGSQAIVNSQPWQSAYKAEQEAESLLLRDIFGPLPFRPVPTDLSWLSWNGGTVPKIAQALYDEHAFDRLPVLADALQDAGCADRDLLTHCRSGGEHVPGCWAVDLLRGARRVAEPPGC